MTPEPCPRIGSSPPFRAILTSLPIIHFRCHGSAVKFAKQKRQLILLLGGSVPRLRARPPSV